MTMETSEPVKAPVMAVVGGSWSGLVNRMEILYGVCANICAQ